MAKQKIFIGGQWKGIGDKWVDDDASRCVDCLNVYTTQGGTELRKRPGIEHSLDLSSAKFCDAIAVRRKDDNDTLAVLINKNPYGTISRRLKQSSTGTLSTVSWSADNEANFPTYNTMVTSRVDTPYGRIAFGDRFPLMIADRYWGYDYNGSDRDYGLVLNMTTRPFLSNKVAGLYGIFGTYKEQLTDGGSGSGILDAGEYGVFVVFEYRLPDNTYLGETVPYYYWYGEEATVTLAAGSSKISVKLPYKKSSTWNLHDLGYDYDLNDGTRTGTSSLARSHFRPTKIRVYRTLKDLTGYYLLEKEIDLSSVSHDGSGYITFDVGATGDLTDNELIEEYQEWRIAPCYTGYAEWYANRLFIAANRIHTRVTGNAYVWFSEVNNPFKYDPNNYIALNASDPITGLIGMPARGMMIILTAKGAQMLNGTSTANFALAPLAQGTGCAWTGTFAKYRNQIVWAGVDGIYMLGDGTTENISPTFVDQILIDWSESYSHLYSAQQYNYWFLAPYDENENSLLFDMKTATFWKWDINVLDSYIPPVDKTVPPDSWDIEDYDPDATEEDVGSATIICRKNDRIGTITRNSLVYGGNNADDDADFNAFYLTSWLQFGTTEVKRIGEVRLHASLDTRIKLRVEASPNPIFSTDEIPAAREMILTGNDFNQVSDIGIAGRYIRFRIESISGYEMVIYGLEVEIETDG